MPETISFGIWLRKRRRALDLTQKGFADQVGCAEITVRRMEADAYKPSTELALILLERLGIPEPERPQWVRFARGLAQAPDQQIIALPVRTLKTNLPVPLTSFIGREKEQEEIKALLSKVRLITIVGTGGMGKTRLSLQVGHELVNEYPDGVWFVPLTPLQSAEAVIPAIARALGFSFYGDAERPYQQLLDYLRKKNLLLILDSFEHLVGEGAPFVAEMLTTAGQIKMLITSRERLNLLGEQVFRMAGLQTPSSAEMSKWKNPDEQIKAYSALQLFEERARRVKQDVQLTVADLAPVAEICRLVDSMPLGIELAATWMEILSPREIAAEIARSLDFLSTSLRDVPERQQSIRAVFESAWKLLDHDEQDVFRKLTIFQGNFSREAAQRVSAGSLHILLELADKSWLQHVEGGRFQLHDILRQYAYELLQLQPEDWQAAKDRHAEYYIDFVETQGKALQGAGQIEAIRALNVELGDNIQVAWNWLVDRERFGDLVQKMLPGLFHFALVQTKGEELIPMMRRARESLVDSGRRETLLQQTILESVKAFFGVHWAVGSQPREQLVSLWAQVKESKLADDMGFWFFVLIETYFEGVGFDHESKSLRESIEKLQDKQDCWFKAYILLSSVKMLFELGLEEQEASLQEALETFKRLGVVYEQALTLLYLGTIAWQKKAFEEAEQLNQAAMRLFELAGDQRAISHVWYRLAELYLSRGDSEQAFHAYQETLRIHEKMGNRRHMGTMLSWQSTAFARYGTLEQAWGPRQKSLALAREVGHLHDIAWSTWELGELYRLMGDIKQACSYYQEAFPLFEALPDYNGLAFYSRGLGHIALELKHWEEARNHFEKSLAILKQEHREMRLWSLSYTQVGLADSLVGLRSFSEARRMLVKSVCNAQSCGNADLILVSLQGFANLYAATGTFERAVELAAIISTHRLSWNETKSQARTVLDNALGQLPEDIASLALERARGMTLDGAIASVLQDN